MDLGATAAFWGVSFLFVITPGADWAYAINAGLRNRVAAAVTGLLLGHVVATSVVAAGVGTLIASLPAVLTTLTMAGALYLLWLGVMTFAQPSVPRVGSEQTQADSAHGKWVLKGIGVSGLNPKVFLLFLALLPQFTDPRADWPLAAQIVALGMVHVASCALIYSLVGFGARAVLGTRPAAARIVSRVAGAAMIAIGAFLIVERLV
jgi:threonine/homoserine/homoserine lactone efflux protein